jgi:hypothetical protein
MKDINQDSKEELSLICDLLKVQKINQINQNVVVGIFENAVIDALDGTNIDKSILFIVQNYPQLVPILGKVIKNNYPTYIERYEKLALLV